jgi:outer membrane protein assembly factor BamB
MSKQLKWLLPLSLLTLVAVVGVLLLPKSITHAANTTTGTTNWSQAGFNARHTYYNPSETTLSVSNVSQLTVKWQATVAGSTPVLANNVLYILSSTDGKEYAFNATTGQQLWSVSIGWGKSGTPPSNAVVNNVVYVSGSQNLYALNAQTGATIWHFTRLHYQPNAVTVANNVVYFYFYVSSTLYALNAQTGTVIWKVTGPLISPSYANGIVYTSAYDSSGNLQAEALNAGTGKLLWQAGLSSDNQFDYATSTPNIANGMVYYPAFLEAGDGTCSNTSIAALNVQSGAVIWQQAVNADLCLFNATAVTKDTFYAIGDVSGTPSLSTFNAMTGSPGLSLALPTYGTPTIANGVLYAGSQNSGNPYFGLYALDAKTGNTLSTISSQSSGSPIVVNGMMYATVGNSLMAFGL